MGDRDRELMNEYVEIETAAKGMLDNINQYSANNKSPAVNKAITETQQFYKVQLQKIQEAKPNAYAELDKKEVSIQFTLKYLEDMVSKGKDLKGIINQAYTDGESKKAKVNKNNSLSEYMNVPLHHAKDVIKKHESTANKLSHITEKVVRKFK